VRRAGRRSRPTTVVGAQRAAFGPAPVAPSAPDQRSACNGDRPLRSLPAVGRHLETFPHVHYGRPGTGALARTVAGTHSRAGDGGTKPAAPRWHSGSGDGEGNGSVGRSSVQAHIWCSITNHPMLPTPRRSARRFIERAVACETARAVRPERRRGRDGPWGPPQVQVLPQGSGLRCVRLASLFAIGFALLLLHSLGPSGSHAQGVTI
jgi:hypothetical protein